MKLLKINNSDRMAIVDDEDYERLSQHTWSVNGSGKGCIGRNAKLRVGKRIYISLASEVMNRHGTMFDHSNRDGFDNQKLNLRESTQSQNMMNRIKKEGHSSKYKGVSWCNTRNKWVAQIKIRGIQTRLGRFQSEKDAALAYNIAAIKYFGEFAILNVI